MLHAISYIPVASHRMPIVAYSGTDSVLFAIIASANFTPRPVVAV